MKRYTRKRSKRESAKFFHFAEVYEKTFRTMPCFIPPTFEELRNYEKIHKIKKKK